MHPGAKKSLWGGFRGPGWCGGCEDMERGVATMEEMGEKLIGGGL